MNKSVINIIQLEEPIIFQDMVDPEQEVQSELIFNLVASKDQKDNHVGYLQKIMEIMNNKDISNKIINSKNDEELYNLLIHEFN